MPILALELMQAELAGRTVVLDDKARHRLPLRSNSPELVVDQGKLTLDL